MGDKTGDHWTAIVFPLAESCTKALLMTELSQANKKFALIRKEHFYGKWRGAEFKNVISFAKLVLVFEIFYGIYTGWGTKKLRGV